MSKNYLTFLLLAIFSSCGLITKNKDAVFVDKVFEDGCRVMVEISQTDSPSRLRLSMQLADIGFLKRPDPSQNMQLQYVLDSAFYILKDNSKIYPAAVQPIATTLPGRSDYIIYYKGKNVFEGNVSLCYKEPFPPAKEYMVELAK